MKLYFLEDINHDFEEWDTYDSMVISANSHLEAKKFSIKSFSGTWPSDVKTLKSKCIGVAKTSKNEVICASFNAG